MKERRQAKGGYNLRKLFNSSLLYSSGHFALKLIGFFLIPLYTRVLTPTDYGVIGFVNAFVQLLSPLIGLGLIGSLPPLYYAYDGYQRQRLISTTVNFTIFYALCLSLILTFFSEPVFLLIYDEVDFYPYLLIGIWTIFFTTLYWLPTGIFNMREQAGYYSIYSVSLGLFGVSMGILFVLILRMGAVGALLANLILGVIGMVVAAWVIRHDYLMVIDWKKLRELLHLALPALPHSFSSSLWRFADRIFLAGMANMATTGLYSLAMNISAVTPMILDGITTALNPMFFRRAHQKDPDLPADWARLFSLFLLAVAATGLGLAMIGSEIIHILTPPKYHAAIPLVPVLVLGQVMYGIQTILSPGINFVRKTWVYPVASFPSVALNLILNYYLIPIMGGMGAAWAMVGAATLQLVIFSYFSQRFFPIPYEYGQIIKVIAVTGIVFIVSQFLVFGLWVGLLFKLVLLFLLPATLLVFGFFSEREIIGTRRFIGRFVARVWRKN